MSDARRTKISSVEDAYVRHDDRWREGLRRLGLDPDVRADHYRAPAGFWWDIQDALRRDLTDLAGLDERVTSRRPTERDGTNAEHERDLQLLRAGLEQLMGHS